MKNDSYYRKITTALHYGGRVLGLVLVTFLACVKSSQAATQTWNNGGSAAATNWNDQNNWSGRAVPASGDSLVFGAVGKGTANSFNNFGNFALLLGSILFDTNATASWTISGNGFFLTNGITNNSGFLATIANAIALSNNVTFNAASNSELCAINLESRKGDSASKAVGGKNGQLWESVRCLGGLKRIAVCLEPFSWAKNTELSIMVMNDRPFKLFSKKKLR